METYTEVTVVNVPECEEYIEKTQKKFWAGWFLIFLISLLISLFLITGLLFFRQKIEILNEVDIFLLGLLCFVICIFSMGIFHFHKYEKTVKKIKIKDKKHIDYIKRNGVKAYIDARKDLNLPEADNYFLVKGEEI